MSLFLYNIFLLFFRAATRIASLFNDKAKKWVRGRRNIFQQLEQAIPPGEKIIWVHCASVGEFEQGRPVMEQLKINYPAYRILLTFFSPSGYEAKKNYPGADWIFYLPIDGPRNARLFLEIAHPSLVIFVKYEFWYYYLKKIKYRKIPLLLVSALFRPDMSFFKWYGGLQKKMLSRFDHLFVQNESSGRLMEETGLAAITSISGDTRFDRVIEIADQWQPIPVIEQFLNGKKALIAGSTWPEDEILLQKIYDRNDDTSMKLIIAPHDVSSKRLAEIKQQFPGALWFSNYTGITAQTNEFAWNMLAKASHILVIDNIGLLSRIYRYGHINYVGGGFRTMGVHNVLEAAVYGKPVITGPYYKKYAEAVGLVESGGGIVVNDEKELAEYLNSSAAFVQEKGKAAGRFVSEHAGATRKIIQFIQEKRLLTN